MKILQCFGTVFLITFIVGLLFTFPKLLLATVMLGLIGLILIEFKRGVKRNEW